MNPNPELIQCFSYRISLTDSHLVSECRGTDRRGVSLVDRNDRRAELRRRAEIEADWGGGRLILHLARPRIFFSYLSPLPLFVYSRNI